MPHAPLERGKRESYTRQNACEDTVIQGSARSNSIESKGISQQSRDIQLNSGRGRVRGVTYDIDRKPAYIHPTTSAESDASCEAFALTAEAGGGLIEITLSLLGGSEGAVGGGGGGTASSSSGTTGKGSGDATI